MPKDTKADEAEDEDEEGEEEEDLEEDPFIEEVRKATEEFVRVDYVRACKTLSQGGATGGAKVHVWEWGGGLHRRALPAVGGSNCLGCGGALPAMNLRPPTRGLRPPHRGPFAPPPGAPHQ